MVTDGRVTSCHSLGGREGGREGREGRGGMGRREIE